MPLTGNPAAGPSVHNRGAGSAAGLLLNGKALTDGDKFGPELT
jgi:hypothetical protein